MTDYSSNLSDQIRLLSLLLGAVLLCVFSRHVSAHHGPPIEPLYDTSSVVNLEGVVTEVFWRNPHVRVRVDASVGGGEVEIWEFEMSPLNILVRAGLDADLVQVGDRVSAAGVLSRYKVRQLALYSLSLPNGIDYALVPEELRQRAIEESPIGDAEIEAARREANGIFRVWAQGPAYGVGRFGGGRHSDSVLTEEAIAAKVTFDSATDPIMDCVPDGMPRGMMHPSPVEFLDEGERIVLLVQEHDLVRTIHMRADAALVERPATPLGYSVGHWDGNTLVVETARIDWPYSDGNGVPQSDEAKHIERFTLSPDEARLDYEMTSIDPRYLRQPAVREGYWEWLPGVELRPYECALWEN